jgi:ribose 5-phosphate isomerase B
MKVYLASDHAGFELKESLIPYLTERGFEVEDMGPKTLEPQDDYPTYVIPLALKVANEKGSFGVIIGLSGQGEAMAANRVRGARAAVYVGGPRDILTLSRMHNDANILSLGSKFLIPGEAKEAVVLWLNTPFSGEERHARRIAQLDHGAN